jgi:hypothetical protein
MDYFCPEYIKPDLTFMQSSRFIERLETKYLTTKDFVQKSHVGPFYKHVEVSNNLVILSFSDCR